MPEPAAARTGTIDAPVPGLGKRFRLTAALLVLITLLAAAVLYALTAARLDDNAQVNASGLQRMLTQRSAWFAERLIDADTAPQRTAARAELMQSAERLLALHERLLAWPHGWLQPNGSAIRSIYAGRDDNGLDARLRAFVAAARRLAAAAPAALTADNPDLRFLQRQAESELIHWLDALTAQYEHDNAAALVRLQRVQSGVLLAAGLALLAVVGLVLFRPAMRRLRTGETRLLAHTAALRRRERALATLRGAMAALDRHRAEGPLLEAVCRLLVDTGGYRLAWVGFAEHAADKPVRPAAAAGATGYLDALRVSWDKSVRGRGPVGSAIRDGEPCLVRAVDADAAFAPWREAALAHGFQAVAAFPLTVDGEVVAALAVYGDEADAFDADELAVLGDLAAELAYGIGALRARGARREAEQQLDLEREIARVLYRVLRLAQQRVPLREKLEGVLDVLFEVEWLGLERKGCIFTVAEGEGRHLRMAAQRGLSAEIREVCGLLPFGRCLCGAAASSAEPVFRSGVDADHDVTVDGMADHGHYCQPIRGENGLAGVLNLYVSAGHRAREAERAFLAAVADTLAGILDAERVERKRRRLAAILEASPDFVAITDRDEHPCYYNAGARAVLGVAAEPAGRERALDDDYADETARRLREEAFPAALAGGMWRGEGALRGRGGESIPVDIVVLAQRADDDSVHFCTVAHDIRDRQRAEQAARAAAVREKHFANSVINSLPGVFCLTDGAGRLRRWNANFEAAVGTAAELDGSSLYERVTAQGRAALRDAYGRALAGGEGGLEVELCRPDGSCTPYFVNLTRVDHEGGSEAAVAAIGIDITERKRLEAELDARATTDALTGACNRLKMEEHLEREVRNAQRYDTPLTVLLFDIDHFKRVNDSHGHDAGDEVLRAVVEVARASLRETDLLGRWGGEEFMVVAPHTDREAGRVAAEKVRAAIAAHPVAGVGTVSASFGVARFDGDETPRQLTKRADAALYRAKESGRNRVCTG